MIINLEFLINKYNLNINGIIHIGAHYGEESNIYSKCSIKDVIWVEANSNLLEELKKRIGDNRIINECLYNVNKKITFKLMNNSQSSSILDLGLHKVTAPQVHVIDKIELETITAKDMIKKYNIDMNNFNFINIDIQGTEYEVLKSFEEELEGIDYIYTEVNKREIYKNCKQIEELDELLSDFERVETEWWDRKNAKKLGCSYRGPVGWEDCAWGDAFYIRKNLNKNNH